MRECCCAVGAFLWAECLLTVTTIVGCFWFHLYSWYALQCLLLLRRKMKLLLRITSQQENGSLVTYKNTKLVFKQSLTHTGWGLIGSEANNSDTHDNMSLLTAQSMHVRWEKGTDRADNWLDVVQTALVVLMRFKRIGVEDNVEGKRGNK